MKIATFALLLLITSVECRNLTKSENQMRLRNCGRQMLETPPFDNYYKNPVSIDYPQNGFLVTIKAFITVASGPFWTRTEMSPDQALGMFISPRHILTSSNPVMDALKQWVGIWKEETSKEDYVQVPLAAMKNHSQNYTLIIRLESATNKTPGVDFYAEEAWLDFRKRNPFTKDPMIITLKKDHPNVNYPCLANNSTALNVTQMMHIYGLNEKNQSALDYRFFPITELTKDKDWIKVERHGDYGNKGGPMIVEIDGKVTVVGMAAFTRAGLFYDVRALNEQICHLSGVCNSEDPEDVSTTVASSSSAPPPPSSTVLPTSTSISTDSSTSASTSTPTSTSTPASTSKTSNPTSPTIPTSTKRSTLNSTWKVSTTGKPYTDEYEEKYLDDSEDDIYEHFEVTADFLMRSRSVGWNWNWAVLGVVWLVVR